jgi:hypothetical protein
MFYEKLAEAKRKDPLGEDNSAYTRTRRRADQASIIAGGGILGGLTHQYSTRPITHAASKLVPEDVTLTPTKNGFILSGPRALSELNELRHKYRRRMEAGRVAAGLTAGLLGAGLMKRRADLKEQEYQARRQARRDRQEK